MRKEVQELIKKFHLIEHPEGGWYKETYRSPLKSADRNLMTSIYFLLTSENASNFHRIKSDELWYFHQGEGLTVHTLSTEGHNEKKLDLAPENSPFYLVKANTIFGSSVDVPNGYAFVSCAVAPGFDFRDFELFSKEELMSDYPEHEGIIDRLTKH